ncbi:EAL domain-containing protein, partial [Escherichia marmotae]|nr:EAL domain-containing protein [Escherichia marmotae]
DFHKKIEENSSRINLILINNNLNNFFSKIEKEADALKDAIYLLHDENEIKQAVIHRMKKIDSVNLVGIMLNNGKYLSFIRTDGGVIKFFGQSEPGKPFTGVDGEISDKYFDPESRPWNKLPKGTYSKWSPWYNCYGIAGKKCFSFSLRPSEEEKNSFALKLMHLDLDERYFSNYLNKLAGEADILFMEQNKKIMVGNEKSMLHLIVRNSSGSYNISNNSGNYTDNVISLPRLPDVRFHYFHYQKSEDANINKYFTLMFLCGLVCFCLLWYVVEKITKKIKKESNKLIEHLKKLANSVYRNDKIEIVQNDSSEIIELKKIINNISDKYKERMERLLNLVSCEQGSCFYINKSVIETNNKAYLAVGMLCIYGLEFVEAIHGSKKYDEIINDIKSKISEKYSRYCDILKVSTETYLLLCHTHCEEFIEQLSILNLPDHIICLRNIYVHKIAICETFVGENVSNYEGKLKLALTAMRENKESEFMFYDDIKAHELDQKVWVAGNIKKGIASSEFYLVYQPIIDMANNKVVGAEALCRWLSVENGIIPPSIFVPVAEEIGLIKELGDFVLETAIGEFGAFSREYEITNDFLLHINVSPWQLNEFDFHFRVLSLINTFSINADQICLEITESAVKDINDSFYNNINILKENGIKISLDDFGSGLADLKKLYKVRPDSIKIDSEFTSGIFDETNRIVYFISSLAREENMPVIAEGVETESQARELQKLGFSHVQGYLYQKPLPFSEWHIDNKPKKRK